MDSRAYQLSADKYVYNPMGSSSDTSYTLYIAATAGYISVPPPYTHVYSVGGPTGEVHAINASSGGLGREIQQVLFVPESDLGQANKTATALVSAFLVLGPLH